MAIMTDDATHRKMRIISVVAATAISLACGTNVSDVSTTGGSRRMLTEVQYAYSAWAPQSVYLLDLILPIAKSPQVRRKVASLCDAVQSHCTLAFLYET
jgi:hypothetical protein